MEPLSFASAFAAIVGLIGQFLSGRDSGKKTNVEEFISWLSEHEQGHQDIIQFLEQYQGSMQSVDALLHEQHDELCSKLEKLDQALASFASMIPGFADLSAAIKPEAKLSDQAIDILDQFEHSGASKLLKGTYSGVTHLKFSDSQGAIDISDERFLEDDLKRLVDLGLLIHGHKSKGDDLYTYTRAASDLVRVRLAEPSDQHQGM